MNATKNPIADPRARYGNGPASTRHFITQRLSGLINIAFLGLLLFLVVRLGGQDRADLVGVIGSFWIGLPLMVLIAIVAIHMRNGMRDVLEDYVGGRMYRLTMGLNSFFCLCVALAGIAAVGKIVFWG
ncbi:succinate dehydrogenase, hydrophobic membrane anchor protein [Devosia faecipullorum]|uniref:succinate dehydrogenase, hydrophobic membrane anchor protein n=1 Tax=Devosia faecipullorum TaxID=2755039 RepID=UPI00187B8D3E|nr:succinate dehydrogenase, hydrophobic membrane anchor protein [Devosia faecipullorum]MBE7732796.1 succinate dehydrogenase, hydrophobic membrane anchor protein [Devosia faecipullorum]